jgi:hypothetical protein
MYFEMVNALLERLVKKYARDSCTSVDDVLAKIRAQMDKTKDEHFQDEPEIDYPNPLCRLGYFYRHAPANATLFEWVLCESDRLQTKLREANQGSLEICSVGGGPGTELLGLAKYLLLRSDCLPREIRFTVLDNVPQWAETWERLAKAVEGKLRNDQVSPTIVDHFLPLDVLNEGSYKDYAFKFSSADIVIFNYLFSENKMRLAEAQAVLTHLARVTRAGCIFVVIDRLERDRQFTNDVVEAFVNAGFAKPNCHTFSGSMDTDEQTAALAPLFMEKLGSPRLRFFTPAQRDPTVFWFETVKG